MRPSIFQSPPGQAALTGLLCDFASRGDINALRDLIHQGANVNSATPYDLRTPLHLAAAAGKLLGWTSVDECRQAESQLLFIYYILYCTFSQVQVAKDDSKVCELLDRYTWFIVFLEAWHGEIPGGRLWRSLAAGSIWVIAYSWCCGEWAFRAQTLSTEPEACRTKANAKAQEARFWRDIYFHGLLVAKFSTHCRSEESLWAFVCFVSWGPKQSL